MEELIWKLKKKFILEKEMWYNFNPQKEKKKFHYSEDNMVYGEKAAKMTSSVWMAGGLFSLSCFCYYKHFGFFLKEKPFPGSEKPTVKGL